MNIYKASNISMNIYGAFIKYYSHAFMIYGFHDLISWISTPAVRQKLRIGQPYLICVATAWELSCRLWASVDQAQAYKLTPTRPRGPLGAQRPPGPS